MSLARNPEMPYIAAGRQENPHERMSVRSHVYVPDFLFLYKFIIVKVFLVRLSQNA